MVISRNLLAIRTASHSRLITRRCTSSTRATAQLRSRRGQQVVEPEGVQQFHDRRHPVRDRRHPRRRERQSVVRQQRRAQSRLQRRHSVVARSKAARSHPAAGDVRELGRSADRSGIAVHDSGQSLYSVYVNTQGASPGYEIQLHHPKPYPFLLRDRVLLEDEMGAFPRGDTFSRRLTRLIVCQIRRAVATASGRRQRGVSMKETGIAEDGLAELAGIVRRTSARCRSRSRRCKSRSRRNPKTNTLSLPSDVPSPVCSTFRPSTMTMSGWSTV